MIRVVVLAMVAVLLALAPVSAASAQLLDSPVVGEEVASVSLRLGLLSPRTTFTDPTFGESSFDSGIALGLTVGVWPILDNRIGFRGSLIRSQTDGQNETSEFAPIANSDPNVYLYMAELAVRHPMGNGFPYLSAGFGGKHYTWGGNVAHRVDRFTALTAAAGYELRPNALGPFGVSVELRGYRSDFRAFGIDDGEWEDGPYGGKVGGVPNYDLLLTTGFALYF